MKRISKAITGLGTLSLLFEAGFAGERIVTLGASVTEIVYALGAGNSIVARDSSSNFPIAARELPDVGYFRTIGAEGVLSMEPSLILAAKDSGPDSQIEILRNSGIGFLHLENAPSRNAVLENVLQVGKLIGKEKEAKELASSLESQFEEAGSIARKSPQQPTVVFLMSLTGSSARAAYDSTAASGIIHLAGGRNPYSGYVGYKTTSPEEIFATDPDVILVSARHRGISESLEFVDPPKWLTATRAWKEGNAHRVDMSYYLVFGPRIGQAAIDMAKLLHGDS